MILPDIPVTRIGFIRLWADGRLEMSYCLEGGEKVRIAMRVAPECNGILPFIQSLARLNGLEEQDVSGAMVQPVLCEYRTGDIAAWLHWGRTPEKDR